MIKLVTVLVIVTSVQVHLLDPKCLISNVTVRPNQTLKAINTSFSKSDYIQVNNNTPSDVQFNYYSKDCVCAKKVCIRKCCSENYSFSKKKGSPRQCLYNRNFTNNDFNFTAKLEFSRYNKPVLDHNVTESNIFYVDGQPCEFGMYRLNKNDEYHLQENGLLFLYYEDKEKVTEHQYTVNEYCLENQFQYDEFGEVESASRYLFICFAAEAVEDEGDGHVKPLAYGMIISIPFLFITFAVYAFIPELQNLHGKSLMCYVFTLMIAYLLLSFIQLRPSQVNPACSIIAFSIYYSFLVSFFWLNIMCFDIWWTFSGIRGFRGSIRDAEHKKFLFYNLYAWGFPTAILLFTLFMEFYPDIPEDWITPKIGNDNCWFKATKETLVYFHIPLACLVFANVFLFIGTALKIAKIKRDTATMLKSKESQRHDNPSYNKDKQRFNLYLKLFIVMGINWVMELISVIFNDPDDPQTYTWIFTDLANTLQGVLIFIIFVCKPQIWLLLVKRYHILMGRPYHANGALSRTQTTSYSISQSTTDTTIPVGGQAVNGRQGSIKLNNFK